MTGYVIKGGRPGYDRLALLARERWPDTGDLLNRAGVAAGMRCAYIGCGGGAVTLEATADAVIAEGIATADEVAAALASLRQLADDARALICGPRVFQVWSRR